MKYFKIKYSEEFVEHLESYIKKLGKYSPRAANKLRGNIRNHILNLKKIPDSGQKFRVQLSV